MLLLLIQVIALQTASSAENSTTTRWWVGRHIEEYSIYVTVIDTDAEKLNVAKLCKRRKQDRGKMLYLAYYRREADGPANI